MSAESIQQHPQERLPALVPQLLQHHHAARAVPELSVSYTLDDRTAFFTAVRLQRLKQVCNELQVLLAIQQYHTKEQTSAL